MSQSSPPSFLFACSGKEENESRTFRWIFHQMGIARSTPPYGELWSSHCFSQWIASLSVLSHSADFLFHFFCLFVLHLLNVWYNRYNTHLRTPHPLLFNNLLLQCRKPLISYRLCPKRKLSNRFSNAAFYIWARLCQRLVNVHSAPFKNRFPIDIQSMEPTPFEVNFSLSLSTWTHADRPVVSPRSSSSGIDAVLSIYHNGIQIVFARQAHVALFYPLASLIYCACIRYAIVEHEQGAALDWRFVPIDATNPTQSKHPPLFAAVMERTQIQSGDECHCFITKNDDAALALVRTISDIYADLSVETKLLKSPIFYQVGDNRSSMFFNENCCS